MQLRLQRSTGPKVYVQLRLQRSTGPKVAVQRRLFERLLLQAMPLVLRNQHCVTWRWASFAWENFVWAHTQAHLLVYIMLVPFQALQDLMPIDPIHLAQLTDDP